MRAVVVSSLVAVASANVVPSLRQLAGWAYPVDNHTSVKTTDTIMTGRMGMTMDLADDTVATTLNKDKKFVASLTKALADSLEGLKEADLKISDITFNKTRTRRLTERALTITGAGVDFNYSMLIADAKVAESVYKLTEAKTFEATLKTKLVAAIKDKMEAADAAKFAVTKFEAFAAPKVTGKFVPWAYPEVVHESDVKTDTVVTGRMGLTMNLADGTTATTLNKDVKFVASLKASLADSLEGVKKADVKISDITIDAKRTRRLLARQLTITGAVVDFKYSMLIANAKVAESVYKLTEAETFEATLKTSAIKAIKAEMTEAEAANFEVTAVQAFAAPVATGAYAKAPASGANSIGVAAALSASLVAAMLI